MTVEANSSCSRRQRYRLRSLARQRGALGILGALTLLLSVLFTALAVDTGRLMLEKRRLQAVADMAALDASSQSGSCYGPSESNDPGPQATAYEAARASAARNNHPVGGNRTLVVTLGNTSTDAATGVRNFDPGDPTTAMSVEVIAGNTVPASLFAGGLLGEEATLQARAVAGRQGGGGRALAGFSAGSGLVSFNTEESALLNSLLNGAFGSTAVNLDLVSYNGIAATNVTLESLRIAAGVGTVQQLLDADLSVGDWFGFYADAANREGVTNVDVENLAKLDILGLMVKFGDILAVTACARRRSGG